jgi:hypothetical protein
LRLFRFLLILFLIFFPRLSSVSAVFACMCVWKGACELTTFNGLSISVVSYLYGSSPPQVF